MDTSTRQPWIIATPKGSFGTLRVWARESREVIGSIIPFHKAGRKVEYMVTRVDGSVRDFQRRWDAAYWLMAGFDAKRGVM